jgi:hypothetical protein
MDRYVTSQSLKVSDYGVLYCVKLLSWTLPVV